MGVFTHPMTVSAVYGDGAREVEGLIDTGATYSLLPGNMLLEMGIVPDTNAHFVMANGDRVTLPMGDMRATIDGSTRIVPVAFGPEDATPLIGAVTLESLRLGVDPVGKRLFPVDAYLT